MHTKESWHPKENQRADHELNQKAQRKSHLVVMQLALQEEKRPLNKFLAEQTLPQAK